jgi:putative ABC transport system substrate-binding protein
MRRRELISLFAGAAAWPIAARAQPNGIRRVGCLLPWPDSDPVARASVTAFADALGRLGWNDDRNIRIDYRFAANEPTLFKTYAAELVGQAPNVIVASTPPTVAAVRQLTGTIPIVFVLMLDPVGSGLVRSLARPGGNVTGFGVLEPSIMGKWLQLLKDVAPRITRVAVIFNPETAPHATLFTPEIEADARSLGLATALAPVHNDAEIEEVVTAHARQPGGGLICAPDSFVYTHRFVINAAAARHGLPAIGLPELVRAGGLISYFFDPVDAHAQAASYVDRILKGANPADLPIQQPTKYSLIINLKTAKALGLTVPPAVLAAADEVIE